jgi:2-dehydropantoate 2-reductase
MPNATPDTDPQAARPKRVLVVGAGAVGSLLGALLGTAGYDVTLIRIFEPNSERPITLIRPDGSRTAVPVHRLTKTDDASDPDLIVVAVKMPALREALAPTLRWPGVPTLTVENGIGAETTATEVRPHAPEIAASLTSPARLVSQDEVQWMGKGGIALSAANATAEPLMAALVSDFGRAGMRASVQTSAPSMKWSKLLANLIANATGAILDMDAGEIYRDRRLYEIERRQLLEALAVMRAMGLRPVSLPGGPVPWLALGVRLPAWLGRPILSRVVKGSRAGKSPSLRIHVTSAPADGPSPEPTEVAWMNGAVAMAGDRLGIATPVNARLATLVDEVAADPVRRAWFRGHPERLCAEVTGR